VLAVLGALLFTRFGASAFEAIGFWVIPLLIAVSAVIHLSLSALAVFVFRGRIQLEIRGTRRAA
jgi:hypothetical protein